MARGSDLRIGDAEAAARLFAPRFAGLAREALCVAHLDAALRLLDVTTKHGAQASSIDLPLRAIIGDALRLGSRAIVVAHNHPGGDPTPSRADKEATRRIMDIASPLDIKVIDHLIFASGSWVSFAAMGLL